MRVLTFLLIALFSLPDVVSAQLDSIYSIVEVKPLLRSCMRDSTDMEREQCTNQKLLNGIYGALVYPEAAVENETEGTVVAQFIVTDRGLVRGVEIIRDIGDGCGEAVARVLRSMENIEAAFRPALIEGRPVNYRFTIPVKFNIPEPPPPPVPYQVYGRDTIYTSYDTYPLFQNSLENLEAHILANLKYPKAFADSCSTGSMVAQVFISKEGYLQMGEIFDYSGLGFDFQFELIQLLNATSGQWTAASFEGKKVNAVYTIRAVFSPKAAACAQVAESYSAANELARQGEELYLDGKMEEAIAAWTKAIAAFPDNGEFRLQRGQALVEQNNFGADTCEDLSIARKNVTISAVLEGSYRIMCGKAEEGN